MLSQGGARKRLIRQQVLWDYPSWLAAPFFPSPLLAQCTSCESCPAGHRIYLQANDRQWESNPQRKRGIGPIAGRR